MTHVRKFEFLNDKGVYSVVETPPETNPKDIPKGDGRFLRTWVGIEGSYRVHKMQSNSKYVDTICKPRGFFLAKNGEHL